MANRVTTTTNDSSKLIRKMGKKSFPTQSKALATKALKQSLREKQSLTANSTPIMSQRLSAIHDAFDREESRMKFPKLEKPETDSEANKKYGPTSNGVGVGY